MTARQTQICLLLPMIVSVLFIRELIGLLAYLPPTSLLMLINGGAFPAIKFDGLLFSINPLFNLVLV